MWKCSEMKRRNEYPAWSDLQGWKQRGKVATNARSRSKSEKSGGRRNEPNSRGAKSCNSSVAVGRIPYYLIPLV